MNPCSGGIYVGHGQLDLRMLTVAPILRLLLHEVCPRRSLAAPEMVNGWRWLFHAQTVPVHHGRGKTRTTLFLGDRQVRIIDPPISASARDRSPLRRPRSAVDGPMMGLPPGGSILAHQP